MVTGRTRLLLVTGVVATLGLVADACGTTAEPTSTDATASASPSTRPTTTGAEASNEVTVDLFFSVGDGSDCSEVEAVRRAIPADAEAISAAFALLVAGPTADEVAAGASSGFSATTAGSVRSVALNDGLLTVDFEDLRNDLDNASTTCGSAALLAQLNGTAFQFPEVEHVTYTIDGRCETFFNWLQRDCEESTRQ